MSNDPSEVRHARIAWRCRRGMRELDLLLARFLDNGLQVMDAADLDRLERLLAEPDQDVLAWIMGAGTAPDVDMERIVAIIRRAIGAGTTSDAFDNE